MRKPDYTSLDLVVIGALRDLQAASQQMLFLPMRQHALMSGWGGPPQTRTLAAQCATTLTTTISYRVPPGVTHIDVEVMASGNGSVTLTTAMDATGVVLWFVDAFTAATDADLAVDVRANGLRMLAAPVWEWTDVDITVAMTGALATYSMTIYPTHVPRASTLAAYYESLLGDGTSYLEASTNLAARYMLPGTGSVASFTLLAWVAQLDGDGRGLVQVGEPSGDSIDTFSEGRDSQSFTVWRGGSAIGDGVGAPPDSSDYFLLEVASDGAVLAVMANGAAYDTAALSGSFGVPADLLRLLSGLGVAARIRNIAIMPGALTSDERTALLAAQYRHDYRTSYDDGAGHVWAGRTMPFHWCTPAVMRGEPGVYRLPLGVTLSTASGPFSGDVLVSFWFRAPDPTGTGPIMQEASAVDVGMYIESSTHSVLSPTDTILATSLDLAAWHHGVLWASGLSHDLVAYLDGVLADDGEGQPTGEVVFGALSGGVYEIAVANIAYVQRTRSGSGEAEIAALYAAGRSHDITAASGSWAAVTGTDLLARWTTEPVAGVVASDGATSLPLTFSTPPGPTHYVVNSGDGGECDLDLIGDTTSETD